MLLVLDALVTMRRTLVPGYGFAHEHDPLVGTQPGLRSTLSARRPGPALQNVCVPIEVHETLEAEAPIKEWPATVAAFADALADLPSFYVSSDGSVRIHSHVLVSETPVAPSATTLPRVEFVWNVVATWE